MEATLPVLPFWFKQRQCKVEATEDRNILQVSGPNLGQAFLLIRPDETGHWQAAVRTDREGEDTAATPFDLESPRDAWPAAFELYRTQMIV